MPELQEIIRRYHKQIGPPPEDGGELPHLSTLLEPEGDPCGGTGWVPVKFGAQIIRQDPCPKCKPHG